MDIDQGALERAIRKTPGFQQIQKEADLKLRSIVREVNASHSGRGRAVVDAELRQRFEEAGVTPVEPAFTETVQAISAGELTDNEREGEG